MHHGARPPYKNPRDDLHKWNNAGTEKEAKEHSKRGVPILLSNSKGDHIYIAQEVHYLPAHRMPYFSVLGMLKYDDSLVGQLTTALVMQTLWGTAPTRQHRQCCLCPSQDFVLRFSKLKWNICFKTEIKVGLDFVVVERRWFNNDLLNHSFTNVLQLTKSPPLAVDDSWSSNQYQPVQITFMIFEIHNFSCFVSQIYQTLELLWWVHWPLADSLGKEKREGEQVEVLGVTSFQTFSPNL